MAGAISPSASAPSAPTSVVITDTEIRIYVVVMDACRNRLEICVLFHPFLIHCGEKVIRLLSEEVHPTFIYIIRGSGLALLGHSGFLFLCHTKLR